MALSSSKNVKDIYLNVVLDVINGVREAFLDEGMDEQVLQELKQLWESKLAVSKAIEPAAQTDTEPVTNVHHVQRHQQQAAAAAAAAPVMMPQHQLLQTQQQQLRAPPAHQQPQQSHLVAATSAQALHHAGQMIGIAPRMTLSAQAATNALPAGVYQQFTQQQHQLTPQQLSQLVYVQPQGMINIGSQFTLVAPSTQADSKTLNTNKSMLQLDGVGDSSSDDDDNHDDDDDDNDDDQNDDADDAEAEEENPLNSDDDVSDSDPTEVFDAENVIVCQFDKINRSKNKWKFHLKDGIMSLNGKDQLFQKATGDAEW